MNKKKELSYSEKEEITNTMVDEIITIEKIALKDINSPVFREVVSKIENKFEEVYNKYENSENENK